MGRGRLGGCSTCGERSEQRGRFSQKRRKGKSHLRWKTRLQSPDSEGKRRSLGRNGRLTPHSQLMGCQGGTVKRGLVNQEWTSLPIGRLDHPIGGGSEVPGVCVARRVEDDLGVKQLGRESKPPPTNLRSLCNVGPLKVASRGAHLEQRRRRREEEHVNNIGKSLNRNADGCQKRGEKMLRPTQVLVLGLHLGSRSANNTRAVVLISPSSPFVGRQRTHLLQFS
ncbi:unnamed protein product [Calicophoron daubneyi]|uniref:Uncharacterized protein n=1 Tax=Calicophoron daubneyi TaxID=300641 RepID=A0AAV2SYE3_CALDB